MTAQDNAHQGKFHYPRVGTKQPTGKMSRIVEIKTETPEMKIISGVSVLPKLPGVPDGKLTREA